MSRRIETAVEIAAAPEAVWQVLTDFPAYPQWNPFIRSIAGELKPGAGLAVSIQPPGKSAMRFRPRVQVAEHGRAFGWLGHLLVPGLFSGLHEFRLEPVAGGTRLHHREGFSGVLVPLIWSGMAAATQAGFEAMNEALKLRAQALGE
jgi:hypothetical protein